VTGDKQWRWPVRVRQAVPAQLSVHGGPCQCGQVHGHSMPRLV